MPVECLDGKIESTLVIFKSRMQTQEEHIRAFLQVGKVCAEESHIWNFSNMSPVFNLIVAAGDARYFVCFHSGFLDSGVSIRPQDKGAVAYTFQLIIPYRVFEKSGIFRDMNAKIDKIIRSEN